MADPHAESPPLMPDGATPPVDFDETLGRAIDAGKLDPSQAADPKLVGAFAAHQKLESLFAALRAEATSDPLSLRTRRRVPGARVGADGNALDSSDSATADEPPSERLGRYQVQSTLGAGAFGTVYLANDPELNRDVAIKVSSLSLREKTRVRADNGSLSLRTRERVPGAGLRAAGIRDGLEHWEERMAREARHAASLNHPGIVTIYDVGREGERLYIVMEYIRGRTLEELLRDGPIAPALAAELLAQIADALHYAHKLGFVPRDLKPANILLDATVGSGLRAVPPAGSLSPREKARVRAAGIREGAQDIGRPKIADFGLAVTDDTQRALAGQIAGTPEYMAPEHCATCGIARAASRLPYAPRSAWSVQPRAAWYLRWRIGPRYAIITALRQLFLAIRVIRDPIAKCKSQKANRK